MGMLLPRIVANVRRLRVELGLTQAAAAFAAGLDTTVWSRLENGKLQGMSLATVEKVARAFEVDPAELFLAAPTANGPPAAASAKPLPARPSRRGRTRTRP